MEVALIIDEQVFVQAIATQHHAESRLVKLARQTSKGRVLQNHLDQSVIRNRQIKVFGDTAKGGRADH